jgi:LysM repeat protein
VIGAALLAAITVTSGDTLSGLAASHGVPLAAVERLNPGITDPDLIFPGEKIQLADDVLVEPGNTLSGIAAAHGFALAAIESANPAITNPNYIYPGERVSLPAGAAAPSVADTRTGTGQGTAPSEVTTAAAPLHDTADVSTAGDGAFQACVISRESGGNPQVMNSTGHYGLYQFSASTWAAYGGNPADFGNATVAQQNAVFDAAMAAGGQFNWSPYDGCL